MVLVNALCLLAVTGTWRGAFALIHRLFSKRHPIWTVALSALTLGGLAAWPFFLAGVFTLVIALLTVSWQAIRAATANPVEALRYE